MRLLDLFSCAGGAGMGYHRAGFEVVGVDIEPQKNYPFEHHVADALEFVREHGHEFDAIHASPPCQAYSVASQSQRNEGKEYPDLLAPTRDALIELGLPYVIENVPGAPMRADYRLCGCYFGLRLRRERWFEVSFPMPARLYAHDHGGEVPLSVVGHGAPTWVREQLGYNPSIAEYRDAMGMHWTNRDELSQAIPPAYTEHIGHDLMSVVRERISA